MFVFFVLLCWAFSGVSSYRDKFHLNDKVHTEKQSNSFLIARAVQTRRGETGPLSPDHLREAYRAYQDETGHVGAARPLRAKKLFVR